MCLSSSRGEVNALLWVLSPMRASPNRFVRQCPATRAFRPEPNRGEVEALLRVWRPTRRCTESGCEVEALQSGAVGTMNCQPSESEKYVFMIIGAASISKFTDFQFEYMRKFFSSFYSRTCLFVTVAVTCFLGNMLLRVLF